jgi:trk system potassium uptake protein TrkH
MMARTPATDGRPRVVRFALSPAQTIIVGFAAVILIGALLLSLPAASANGRSTPFLTALFTSTTAVCVTGLVVVDTADHFSTFGELVILALIQVGGFGYMTSWSLLALLLGWRIGLRERIVLSEAHNLYALGGVVRFTRRLILFTLGFEAAGAAVLTARWAAEMPLGQAAYHGVFHSVSAFNNAGFDLMGGFRSLTAFAADPVVSLTILGLAVIGGIGFTVVSDVWTRRLTLHSRTVMLATAALLVGGAAAILALEFNNPDSLGTLPVASRIMAALFHSGIARTAGFSTVQTSAFTEPTLMVLVALMFIGGSPGGTAGGIKTTTFVAPLALIWSAIRGTTDPVLFLRRIPVYVVYKAVTVALIAVALVVTMSILLTVSEGIGYMPVLFETVSAFATVGLSTGITPNLSPVGLVLLIVTIFTGRVGLLTLAFALTRRQKPPLVRYPEERLYVG